MNLLKKIVHKIHPACPISEGASGPYEYVQLLKDGEITWETPRSCLEFLQVKEYMPKLAVTDSDTRNIWINNDEMEAIRKHRHTVFYTQQ